MERYLSLQERLNLQESTTARAHHSLRVEAQSWQGKIVTRLRREKDGDYFDVWREPHGSSGGDSLLLTSGRLDLADKFPKENAA
jgi:hypothetical protein